METEHPTISITIVLQVKALLEIQLEFLHLVQNQQHRQQHPLEQMVERTMKLKLSLSKKLFKPRHLDVKRITRSWVFHRMQMVMLSKRHIGN